MGGQASQEVWDEYAEGKKKEEKPAEENTQNLNEVVPEKKEQDTQPLNEVVPEEKQPDTVPMNESN